MSQSLSDALIAAVSAATLMLMTSTALAGSGGAPRNAFATTRPMAAPVAHHAIRHHHGRGVGFFTWPPAGDESYGPPPGAPMVDMTPPAPADVHTTYTYDVPWDWAHRYPPNVTPSNRPYVPSCTAEPVTVPGRGGAAQTVNVTRCY